VDAISQTKLMLAQYDAPTGAWFRREFNASTRRRKVQIASALSKAIRHT
jgi:hypothetical protein